MVIYLITGLTGETGIIRSTRACTCTVTVVRGRAELPIVTDCCGRFVIGCTRSCQAAVRIVAFGVRRITTGRAVRLGAAVRACSSSVTGVIYQALNSLITAGCSGRCIVRVAYSSITGAGICIVALAHRWIATGSCRWGIGAVCFTALRPCHRRIAEFPRIRNAVAA